MKIKKYHLLLLFALLVSWSPVLSASAQAPIVTIAQNCALWGNNGWCLTSSEIHISMPGGTVVCSPYACDVYAGNGVQTIYYTATDTATGLSTSGSVDLKVDTLPPWANLLVPSPTGSNGWFKTSPVVIPVNTYDFFSGLNTVWASPDGGTTWQTWTQSSLSLLPNGSYLAPGLSLSSDGQYVIPYRADDLAGNSRSYPGISIKIDATPPAITPSVSGTLGSNGWYISNVDVTASGSDVTSGLASSTLSINGGIWQSSALLTSDGVYTLDFMATDNAGNTASTTRVVSIDKIPPTVNYTISGAPGANGWHVSQAMVSATAFDSTSGVNTLMISDNGGAGQASPVTLGDGTHNLIITATDKAGNHRSVSQTVYVDTKGPVISPSVTGITGTNNWYVSAVNMNATAFDGGSGLKGDVELSLDNGFTWSSLPVQLSEGTHSLTYRAYDNAGNLSDSSAVVNVDTTPPSFSKSTTGTSGNADWYVSGATTYISASDGLSGTDHIEYNQNDAGWQTGSSFTSREGVNAISIQVFDKAGNVSRGSMTVKVDSEPPTSSFSEQSGNDITSGTIHLRGTTSDATSGLQFAEVSMDGGTTWNAVTISGNTWSHDWDTTLTSNGTYTVLVRAGDTAGNLENSVPFTFTIDNFPPTVKLTDWWWIWDSGEYKVSKNGIAIGEITVKISDPEDRWSSVVLVYDPSETSARITWDRRFPGDVLAPSGNYDATVKVCDIHGNCGSDRGQIRIPFLVPVPPTATPSPILSAVPDLPPGSISLVTAIPFPTHVQSVATQSLLVVGPVSKQPTVEGRNGHTFPILAIVSFIALLWVLSSASLVDPRPKAILEIAKTISMKEEQSSLLRTR